MDEVSPNIVIVTGTGTAEITPEVAEFTVTLETRAESPGAAMAAATTASHAVLAAAREQGIDDQDVRTEAVAVGPYYDQRSQQISGYVAGHGLRVRLRNLDDAPTVLDAVAGAAG